MEGPLKTSAMTADNVNLHVPGTVVFKCLNLVY